MSAKRELPGDFDSPPSLSPKKRMEKAPKNPWTDEDLDLLWGAIYEIAKNNVAVFAALPQFKEKGRNNSAIHLKLKSIFRDKTKNIK